MGRFLLLGFELDLGLACLDETQLFRSAPRNIDEGGIFCVMRSVTVTTTLLPLSILVTLSLVPKGCFLCDAVSLFLS